MTTATLDGHTVTLTGIAHSHSFPLQDTPNWIAMYTELRDRKRGIYASIYADTVEALEDLWRDAKKPIDQTCARG
jgi:hypothetical protein